MIILLSVVLPQVYLSLCNLLTRTKTVEWSTDMSIRVLLFTTVNASSMISILTSRGDAITGPLATIIVGSEGEEEEFRLPRQLLCHASAYFQAALNGPFLEGRLQKIVLEDEDPAVFRTFATWLYQGRLVSKDLCKRFPESKDFESHIIALLVFADKRHVMELKNDTFSMFVSYLGKVGLACRETVEHLYSMPDTDSMRFLRQLLVDEEIHLRKRIGTREFDEFPSRYLNQILVCLLDERRPRRFSSSSPTVDIFANFQGLLCSSLHTHAEDRGICESFLLNIYHGLDTIKDPSPNSQLPRGQNT